MMVIIADEWTDNTFTVAKLLFNHKLTPYENVKLIVGVAAGMLGALLGVCLPPKVDLGKNQQKGKIWLMNWITRWRKV